MGKLFCFLILGLIAVLLSIKAQADESQLSFDKMRSSFDESFDNKAVTVPVVTASSSPSPSSPSPSYPSDTYSSSETYSYKSYNTSGGANPFINFMEWALGSCLAIWVVWDASNIGVKKGQAPGFPDFGPIGWFFLTLCCWCIGFPFYIAKRKAYIEANKKVPAV